MVDKIDSNATGLRFAEEATPKTLIVSPIWYPLEPNSYDGFGPEYAKIPRRPIGPTRQKRKGVVSGFEASGGFNQDLTFSNLTRLLQGFFFANIREKQTTKPMNGSQVSITAVATADDSFTAAAGLSGILSGDLLFVSGASIAANNGLKVADGASTGTTITVAENLTDESPSANAIVIKRVGYQFDVATADITIVNGLPRINRASGAVDYTTLGLIPGEWVHLGGDDTDLQFVDNQGFARVKTVAAAYIEFDKTTFTPVAETGTGLTVQIFFGDMIKNESDPSLILHKTVQLERTLGNDGVGTQSEYLTGAYANELTINVPEEDKVNIDLSFVCLGHEKRTGTIGVKSGTRPTAALEEAYNTTIDTTRFRMSYNRTDGSVYTPLFAYATEMTITINNNVSPNKAITVLGGFASTAGLFEVGGEVDAYFADTSSVQAIEDNSDISLDVWIQRDNKALMFDIPNLQLGDGQLEVELDEPIKLPLSNEATESQFNSTLAFQCFSYLPDLAG